jgi:hypothetical protein
MEVLQPLRDKHIPRAIVNLIRALRKSGGVHIHVAAIDYKAIKGHIS